jgi:hypothetical protein
MLKFNSADSRPFAQKNYLAKFNIRPGGSVVCR